MRDPFSPNNDIKDPFSSGNQKNPFETGKDSKDNAAFKNSGPSLGLKEMNSSKAGVVNSYNNVFKTGIPSPMNAFYPSGMDSGTEAGRQIFFYQNPQRNPIQMFSPSGGISNRARGAFQTPTSKGFINNRPGDMSTKREDAGSFGGTPKDISTTKAVFNQQTKFANPGKDDNSNNFRQVGREVTTPQNTYFSNASYGMVNYQPAAIMVPHVYGNTPTGGSFGASPANWGFNMPSPNTGMATINMTPFNRAAALAQGEGSVQDHHSPKFNSVPDSNKFPQNAMQSPNMQGQYQGNNPQSYPNMMKMNPAYAASPANAFSFSCKSGIKLIFFVIDLI